MSPEKVDMIERSFVRSDSTKLSDNAIEYKVRIRYSLTLSQTDRIIRSCPSPSD